MRRALAAALAFAAAAAGATCPPAGETKDSLLALRKGEWKAPAEDAPRNALALALLDCLSDPDPALRDLVAFDALQNWMRTGRIDGPTLATLRERLLAMLAVPPDPAGFTQPFAALAAKASSASKARASDAMSASPLAMIASAVSGALMRLLATTGISTACFINPAAQAKPPRGTA